MRWLKMEDGGPDQAQQRRGPHEALRGEGWLGDGQGGGGGGGGGGHGNHQHQLHTSDHRDCEQETECWRIPEL